jgi:hypothetical protein
MAPQAVRKDRADAQVAGGPEAADALRGAGAMPLDPLVAALSRAVERSDPSLSPGHRPNAQG